MIVDCGRTLMCDVWLIFTSLSTNQHCSHSDHHRCFKNCPVKKISSKNIVKYFHSDLDSSTLIHFTSVKIPPKFLVTMKIISTIVLLLLLPCYHQQMLLMYLPLLPQSVPGQHHASTQPADILPDMLGISDRSGAWDRVSSRGWDNHCREISWIRGGSTVWLWLQVKQPSSINILLIQSKS